MAANKIYLEVVFASQDANKNIVELNKNIKGIGNAAEEGSKKANSSLKSVSVSVESTSRAFEQMGAALAGLGIAKVLKDLVGLGGELNRIQEVASRIPGGSKALQEISEFAKTSAFSIDVLYQNFNKLQTLGVPAGKAADAVMTFAAAVGKTTSDQNKLNAAVDAFGATLNQNFVTGKSLYEAFGNTGVNVMELLRDATHKSIQQIRSDTNLLNAKVIADVILLQSKINNIMAGRGTSDVSDRVKQLTSSWQELGKALDTAVGPSLVKIISLLIRVVDLATEAVKQFDKLPEGAKDVAVGGAAVGAGVLGTAATVGSLYAFGKAAKTGYQLMTGAGAAAAGAGVAGATAGAAGGAGAGGAALFATEIASGPAGWALLIATVVTAVVAYLALSGSDKKVAAAGAGGAAGTPGYVPSPAENKEIVRLKAEIARLNKNLYAPDEQKIEQARNILSEAQKKYALAGKESIEALTYEYEEHFRTIGKDATAHAILEKALAKSVDAEIRNLEEERRKDSLKAAEELAAAQQQTAISALSVVPDQTYSNRQRVAEETARLSEEQIRRQRDAQIKEYDRQHQQQINAAKKLGTDTAVIEKEMADNRVEQNKLADEKIKDNTVKLAGQTNALLEDLARERRQAEAEFREAAITSEREQLLAIAQLRQAQTLRERLEQIKTVEAIELQSIAKLHKERLDALDAEAEAQAKLARDAGNTAGASEIDERFGKQRAQLLNQKESDLQMARFNAWKETDQLILEEQKSMYESMKSAADQIWDAFMDRSKSLWESIGNLIKTSILGAIKSIVTSRLAAGLTEMFGGGPVGFEGGLRGINRPIFSGNPAERPGMVPWTSAQSGVSYTMASAGTALNRSAILLSNAAQNLMAAAGAIGGGGAIGQRFGSASRSMDDLAIAQSQTGGGIADGGGGYTGGYGSAPSPPYTGTPGVTTPTFNPQTGSYGRTLQNAARTFGIGQPVQVVSGSGSVTTVPWAQATGMQRLGAIAKSPGAMSLALGMGSMIAMHGLQQGGLAGGAQSVGGAALAGIGAASMFPALGLTYLGGGLLGAGVGLAAAGLVRGGKVGAAMTIGGGALAGAVVGTAILPGLGTLAGAAIGAGIGAVASVIRLLNPTLMERIPKEIKRIYGVNITDRGVIAQIAELVKQKYGGDLSVAVYSEEVQNLVRLYALSVGQSQSGLPRPMYSATFQQSQAGGLQLQPVYSGGQMVASPYAGTTTTQLSNSLLTNPAIYMQLDPAQAQSLFEGRVTQVLGNNPGSVAAANTAAARNGQGRVAQASTLMEPLTVMR
jgi:hypothetical protein